MLKTNLADMLEKAMDGSMKRHMVISNNIANVNTPGYKRKEVVFQEALKGMLQLQDEEKLKMKTTNVRHYSGIDDVINKDGASVFEVADTSLRNDENNVDADMELAYFAENNLYFNGLVQMLSAQMSLLRHAISEGR